MTDTIDISIVIPAYNVEKYIKRCVQSAVEQNPAFKEIIVIDDGSTDHTADIVSGITAENVQLYSQSNIGLSQTRNKGIELATGTYIYFLDGDDYICSDFTRTIKNVFHQVNMPLDAVGFSSMKVGDINENPQRPHKKDIAWHFTGTYDNGKEVLIKGLKSGKYPLCVWLFVIRKELLLRTSLYFKDIIHEDAVFTPDFLMNCGTIEIIDQALCHHTIRSNSITRTPSSINNVIGYLHAVQCWIRLAQNVDNAHKLLFYYQACRFYAQAMRHATHAKLGPRRTQKIVQELSPMFRSYAYIDYVGLRIFRSAATRIMKYRAKRIMKAHWAHRK